MSLSVLVSTADVESSRIRIFGFLSSAVGFLDGRDALRDDDLRGVRDLVVERFADELVRLGVHR